jgi:phosphatidylserine decarboxylase
VVPLPDDNPLGPGATQVSIFLSIFDVHINRAPIAGRIADVRYHKGEFLPAFDDKASLRNEQNTVTVDDGRTRVVFKQIAGLIARRIVFWKKVDDRVARGERVGLIKFGSRVDVFLPRNVAVRVKVGDRVAGGTSVLGELP